ncbi:MAG: DUF58 domain-containing protein [Proteobacteria bacterium]|nr:MAG: DUF58 domain-containing protein [Pseudomonadota bacterium]
MKIATKKLLIRAKRNIFGELAGNNISLKSGDGFDFYELRPYNYGEDVRRVDWKRSAKMGKPYVKLFHEEKELQILIVPILSGSLKFGLQRLKQDVVAEIVALLGFSALKNSDRYSVITCKNKDVNPTKLSKKEALLYGVVEDILDGDFLGISTGFEEVNEFILKRYKRRSMVVFVGDFWSIPNLKYLAKKHEALALIVRDKFEEDPKPIGQISQINPDNLSISNLFVDKSVASRMAQKAKEHDAKLIGSLLKQGIRMQKIYTDDNVFSKLSHFLGS